MNSEKQVMMRYEISSDEEEDESDKHQEELVAQDDDDGTAVGGGGGTITKRSYDCTFCKRGFTNAQALGGHMNIHRKDRAKAKQVITTPNSNCFSSSSSLQNTANEEEFMVLPFSSEFSNQFPTRNYSILESQMNNCDMYFQPPPPLPASNTYLVNQHASPYPPYEFHNLRSHHQPVNINEELGGANLSLQIGPSHHVDNSNQARKRTQKDGEVDLELRLGHDPC